MRERGSDAQQSEKNDRKLDQMNRMNNRKICEAFLENAFRILCWSFNVPSNNMIVSMEPEHEQSKLIKDLKLRKMFILRFLHFLTRNDFFKEKMEKSKGIGNILPGVVGSVLKVRGGTEVELSRLLGGVLREVPVTLVNALLILVVGEGSFLI